MEHRTRSRKLYDLLLLFLMLGLAFCTWEAVDNLSQRIKVLENIPEKTLEIVVERTWDRKNANYKYKLKDCQEITGD